jgi:hypothetical protein
MVTVEVKEKEEEQILIESDVESQLSTKFWLELEGNKVNTINEKVRNQKVEKVLKKTL